MLKGKEFGKAVSTAIQMKLDSGAARSKAEIARHFGVKPPSVEDWIKKGAIAKEKLPELWRYFSDVAGPEHWGMTEREWPSGLSAPGGPIERDTWENKNTQKDWPFTLISQKKINDLSETELARLEGAFVLAANHIGLDIKT